MKKGIINWADEVWQPCSGCSKACTGEGDCFAKGGVHNIDKNSDTPYQQSLKAQDLYFSRHLLPFRLGKPRRFLVNQDYELFDAPDKCIQEVFKIMDEAHWHTFMVVTGDPDRMAKWLNKYYKFYRVPDNIWFGVQVVDSTDSYKIELLKKSRAEKKFILFEPLLGTVKSISLSLLTGIDWVIAGGEVGVKSNLMHKEEVLALLDMCKHKSIPFFFNRWGDIDEHGHKVGYKNAGRLIDGHLYDEVPEDNEIRF